jgi:hypothetical protein
MNKIADSLKLALINLLGTTLALVLVKTRYSSLGSVWIWVFILPFFVLTIAFGVRDFLRRGKKGQAVVAVAVSLLPMLLLAFARI